MVKIIYPDKKPSIKMESEVETVFCIIRKRWVQLTPEEWVRQNFINYLVQVMKYPVGLIAQEKMIRLGEMNKRFDILVYDHSHQPWLMVECKAPEITLSESTLRQIMRYTISIPVPYVVITNGDSCFGWKRSPEGFLAINSLPVHGG